MKIFKSNIHHNERVRKISFQLNIPEAVVEDVLDEMYEYIRGKFMAIEIDKNNIMSEEQFNKAFPIIYIPSIGWFRPSFKKYTHMMKNKLKSKNKKNGKT